MAKKDVTIAKNYLEEKEIRELNSLINMLLDYIELMFTRRQFFKMNDWSEILHKFLEFNEYDILQNYGNIKKSTADNFANNLNHYKIEYTMINLKIK